MSGSKIIKFASIFIFVFILALLPCYAQAFESIYVDIQESGKITSFYNEYFIVHVEGNITITNPTNSSIYDLNFELYLSSLDVKIVNGSDNFLINSQLLQVYEIPPLSSLTFDYKIVGITTEDLSSNNQSVLKNAITRMNPKIYSNLMGSLQKAQLENESITGQAARVVSVNYLNPTGLRYNLGHINVIKTSMMNPNEPIATWPNLQAQKGTLAPYENFVIDIYDTNATEGEIYWLDSDIYTNDIIFTGSVNLSRFDQDDIYTLEENHTVNATPSNRSTATLPVLEQRVYLRKFVDKKLVVPGEEVKVDLVVNNLGTEVIEGALKDFIPSGFEFVSSDNSGTGTNSESNFNVRLDPNSAKRYRYVLKYGDEDSLGVDYFKAAELQYGGKTIYSQVVPFVRKYLPEKKLFVQKSVKFLNDDEVQVIIQVQNMGESDIYNLIVKEFLANDNEFKEITQAFESKGVWKIVKLAQGATWEVSYVTDRTNVLNTFPSIFGVAKASILQTIILSNVITSKFKVMETTLIEIIGVISLLAILVTYFLPVNYFRRKTSKQVDSLRVMGSEIRSLKDRTDTGYQTYKEQPKKQVHHVAQTQAPVQGQPSGNMANAPLQAAAKPQEVDITKGPDVVTDDRRSKHDILEENKKILEKLKEELSKK